MNMQRCDEQIRVLIADDDEHILACYREAFGGVEPADFATTLGTLEAELFDVTAMPDGTPSFEVVSCSQGDDAIRLATRAARDGHPFDVVILDVRMPPGIDGVEAGRRIRALDPDVEIVFVSGFCDLPIDELERRVPPPKKLHYFNKPISFSQLAQDVVSMVTRH